MPGRKSLLYTAKRYKVLILMLLPGAIYLLINNYLPMFGVIIAFKDVNYAKGIWHSDWTGWSNFGYLFQTRDAWIITRNTLLYNIAFITITLIASLSIALLMNELKRALQIKFFQSVLLLPFFISSVIVGYLVYGFLSVEHGFVNAYLLEPLGFEAINWYSDPKYWPYILVAVNTWKSAGYFSIIYFAAIIGIDQEYYEAATIDGASKWKQTLRITLPLIVPVIVVMLLLQVGKIFYSDFGLFYQVPLDTGALLPTTNVIDTYVYRTMLRMGNIGMASAAGLYQSAVGFLLVFGTNYIVRKINRDNALF